MARLFLSTAASVEAFYYNQVVLGSSIYIYIYIYIYTHIYTYIYIYDIYGDRSKGP